ncbi:hypothetical protein DFJ74DRAFT_682832 [Hyaloraphidium curvatum]|nr:hypothetical protein DFJ74DRAFT_682832 [Hyaloraphidium curvatum]
MAPKKSKQPAIPPWQKPVTDFFKTPAQSTPSPTTAPPASAPAPPAPSTAPPASAPVPPTSAPNGPSAPVPPLPPTSAPPAVDNDLEALDVAIEKVMKEIGAAADEEDVDEQVLLDHDAEKVSDETLRRIEDELNRAAPHVYKLRPCNKAAEAVSEADREALLPRATHFANTHRAEDDPELARRAAVLGAAVPAIEAKLKDLKVPVLSGLDYRAAPFGGSLASNELWLYAFPRADDVRHGQRQCLQRPQSATVQGINSSLGYRGKNTGSIMAADLWCTVIGTWEKNKDGKLVFKDGELKYAFPGDVGRRVKDELPELTYKLVFDLDPSLFVSAHDWMAEDLVKRHYQGRPLFEITTNGRAVTGPNGKPLLFVQKRLRDVDSGLILGSTPTHIAQQSSPNLPGHLRGLSAAAQDAFAHDLTNVLYSRPPETPNVLNFNQAMINRAAGIDMAGYTEATAQLGVHEVTKLLLQVSVVPAKNGVETAAAILRKLGQVEPERVLREHWDASAPGKQLFSWFKGKLNYEERKTIFGADQDNGAVGGRSTRDNVSGIFAATNKAKVDAGRARGGKDKAFAEERYKTDMFSSDRKTRNRLSIIDCHHCDKIHVTHFRLNTLDKSGRCVARSAHCCEELRLIFELMMADEGKEGNDAKVDRQGIYITLMKINPDDGTLAPETEGNRHGRLVRSVDKFRHICIPNGKGQRHCNLHLEGEGCYTVYCDLTGGSSGRQRGRC